MYTFHRFFCDFFYKIKKSQQRFDKKMKLRYY